MNRKSLYLLLAVVGFMAPNIFVAIESVQTGNVLLWLDPAATIRGMFGNRITTAFVVDLLFAVLAFLVWTYFEGKRYSMKNIWKYWLLTLLFGMAGTLPLFLYDREKKLSANQ
jgi:hypothetical protein